MSNVIVHPLIDATISQMTVIQNLLEGTPSAQFVIAAKMLMTSTKLMLNGNELPGLPASTAPTERVSGKPMIMSERAPREKQKRKYKRRAQNEVKARYGSQTPTYEEKENMRAGVLDVLAKAGGPVVKRFIIAEVQQKHKSYGISPKLSDASWRRIFKQMYEEGLLKREGITAQLTYELA